MQLKYKDYSFIKPQGRDLLQICAIFQLLDTVVETISLDITQDNCLQSFLSVLEFYLTEEEYKLFMKYLSEDVADSLKRGVKKSYKPKRRVSDVT